MTVIDIVKETGLKHVAIIMDGNRRWAKEKNLPSAIGHKKGVEAFVCFIRRFMHRYVVFFDKRLNHKAGK